jgi:hypothetical protein
MGAPVRPASNNSCAMVGLPCCTFESKRNFIFPKRNIAASTAENQGNGAQRSDDF